jgi:3-oxo-5-alpha-steroid 4-dehydrogenase 1
MSEPELHSWLVRGVLLAAALTAPLVLFVSAPYGRHARPGWGPSVNNRLGWICMETPAVLLFSAVYLQGRHAAELVPLVMLCTWQLHYVYRTYVFPFRLAGANKRMPVAVMLLGFGFQCVNAWLNARFISELGRYDRSWLGDPRFGLGLALFLSGFAVNLRADEILLRLRKPGESGYRIPHGFLYRYVSSPNYLGELLEWAGWALLTWSGAGLAFAVYTAANLVPRALSNHRWYREKFAEYPRERRAIIPFVL